jgi:hypothetical protein
MKTPILAAATLPRSLFSPVVAQQLPAPEPITDPDAYAVYASLNLNAAPVMLLQQETARKVPSQVCARDGHPRIDESGEGYISGLVPGH